jgi:hypothetical protein
MAGEIRQMMKLFVFAFLYFASVMPVVISLIVVFTLEEHFVGYNRYNTLYFNGDISTVASLLVIGSLVFGGCSWALVRLEGMTRPTHSDHLRHCAFIHAFVGILGALFAVELVGNFISGNPVYQMSKAAVVWVVAVYAIFVDVLVFIGERRRFERASLGGGA